MSSRTDVRVRLRNRKIKIAVLVRTRRPAYNKYRRSLRLQNNAETKESNEFLKMYAVASIHSKSSLQKTVSMSPIKS